MPYLGKQPVNVIKNNAVSTDTIVDDAVTNAKVAPSAINTTELADDAVHTAKINANAVTDAKLNDNAVTTNKIVDLNVTQGKLAAEAVSEAKLHVGNAPTNDYVLTAASGQPGGLIWSSPGSIANFTTVTAGAVSNALTYDVTVQKDKLYLIELTGIWGSNETNNASGGNYMRLQASDNAGTSFVSQHYGDANTWYPSAGNGSTSNGITWLYLSRDLNAASTDILNAFATDPTYNLNLYYYQGSETGSNVFNSAVWGMGLHKNRDAIFVNGGFSGGATSPINLLRFSINDASMNGYIRVLRRD